MSPANDAGNTVLFLRRVSASSSGEMCSTSKMINHHGISTLHVVRLALHRGLGRQLRQHFVHAEVTQPHRPILRDECRVRVYGAVRDLTRFVQELKTLSC